jgi:carbon starvation protein CstA
MLLFFTCVGLLVLGYVVYGSLVERLFGADPARRTPAEAQADGVDYVPLPPGRSS